jgi:hypothetical protein
LRTDSARRQNWAAVKNGVVILSGCAHGALAFN